MATMFLGDVAPYHSSRLSKLKEHFLKPTGGARPFGTNVFSYKLNLAGLEKLNISENPTESDITELHKKQFEKFSAIANVDFVEVFDDDAAQINFGFEDIDGESGVLAYVGRPANQPVNIVDNTTYAFDLSHTCKMSDVANIFLHEDGHVLGVLEHGPLSSIMKSFYIFGTPEQELDDWTINQVIKIHGVRRKAA